MAQWRALGPGEMRAKWSTAAGVFLFPPGEPWLRGGGLTGRNIGDIVGCQADVDRIWGYDGAGGLVGHNWYEGCIVGRRATCNDVHAWKVSAGGLVGTNDGGVGGLAGGISFCCVLDSHAIGQISTCNGRKSIVPSRDDASNDEERRHQAGRLGGLGRSGGSAGDPRCDFGCFRLTLRGGQAIIKMLFHLAPAFPPTTSSKSRGTFSWRGSLGPLRTT